MQPQRPLIVDVDGTLLRSDSLQEAVAANLRHPFALIQAGIVLVFRGKAAMKRTLAQTGRTDLASLPFNAATLALVDERVASGGAVYLATGADQAVAESLITRIDGVTGVFASDGVVNLTGAAKAQSLVEEFGEAGFDYAGNSRADIPVWASSHDTYVATLRRSGIPRWARSLTFDQVLRDPAPPLARAWAKELRLHQSLKNLLLFLPLVAAHELADPSRVVSAIGGFVAFCLMASSVYLVNDLLDVSADRAHARKQNRPIAAGWIAPLHALLISVVLALGALSLALFLSPRFLAVLVAYAVMTTAYSVWLKRIVLVDIVILALLYMVRIVAGAVVTDIALSFWFTGVTLFLFLSLALVKRYAEAHQAQSNARGIPGRGYFGDDVHAILALGTSAGVASVLLMATYVQSSAVSVLYPAPTILWLVIPLFFYWISNLWVKAGRGQMNDDPVIFALRDRASVVSALLIVVTFVVASLPSVTDFGYDILGYS